MKYTCKSLLAIALTVISFAAVGNLHAQGKLNDINVVTVALKLRLQSPGYNSRNGQTRSYANPLVQSINTKNLLDRLALDKLMQGLYANSSFPGGSKLALAGNQFVVVGKNNDFIVDVSDILSFSAGQNDILSGKVDTTTGLASHSTTELSIVTLAFDDTFIVGGSDLNFTVLGLDTTRTNDSTPNSSTGKYNENTSDNISNATGEGQSGGTPFVITGTVQGKRKVSLTYVSPAS